MDEDFGNEPKKNGGIYIAIVLILAIAVIVGVIFINSNKKPEKIFSKNVEKVFEMTKEEVEDVNAAKVELELSAEINGTDPEIKATNEILKAIKLKLISEYDQRQKYFNGNVIALYNNEEVLNASGIIQDDTMYFYLKDLFNKYIEVDDEYLEGIDLSSLFEITTETINQDLLKDIEKVILDELKEKEFEKEKVELDGKKVQKSTLKLTPAELVDIAKELLTTVNKYENSTEIKELIDSMKEANVNDEEGYAQISIFTKGMNSDVAKVQFLIVADETVGGIDIENKSDDETVISFLLNENSSNLDDATKYFELTIKKEDENKGTMLLKIFEPEGNMSVTLTLKYSIDYDTNIQPVNIVKTVKMNDMTDRDFEEIQANIENNEILSSLIELLGESGLGSSGYPGSISSSVDYQDYSDLYDYNYNY